MQIVSCLVRVLLAVAQLLLAGCQRSVGCVLLLLSLLLLSLLLLVWLLVLG
jgi:hypothetical protein